MSAFIAPVIGYVIDRVGRNILFVFVAVVITLVSHCILGFSHVNPYFAIVPMGVGYSLLAAALWPIIALVVPLHRQGTAFGELKNYKYQLGSIRRQHNVRGHYLSQMRDRSIFSCLSKRNRTSDDTYKLMEPYKLDA